MEESIDETDPYLATDEDGNVDLEAIDAQTAEQSGQTPTQVQESAPQIEVVETVEEVAPVEVVESQPEPTEVVDTSSDGGEATTVEQSGQ